MADSSVRQKASVELDDLTAPVIAGATRHAPLLLVIFLGGALLRFGGVDGVPEDWDALDFLLGVEDFDLIEMQPHLPGYPLYMVLARLVHLVGLGPALALEVLGAAAGTLTMVVAYRLLASWTESRVAVAAAALLAVQPALVAEAPRMHSDTVGLLVALLSLLLVSRHRSFSGGLVAGLALGVRLAYAPLVAGVLLFHWFSRGRVSATTEEPTSRTGRLFLGIVAGLLAWGVPFSVFHGPELLAEAGPFLRGHVFEWGGTPLSAESPGLVAGLMNWMTTLARVMTGSAPETAVGTWGLGLTGVLVLVGCVRCVGASGAARLPRAVSWLIVPYGIWLVVGQNASNFRHALPVALCLTPMVALGWSRARAGSLILGAVVCLYAASSADFVLRSRNVPPPADSLARYLSGNDELSTRYELLYSGGSYRFLKWREVHYRLRVTRALDLRGVVEDVNSLTDVPGGILVTSDVARIPGESRPLVSFTAPGFLRPQRLDLHRFLTQRGEDGLYRLELPGVGR